MYESRYILSQFKIKSPVPFFSVILNIWIESAIFSVATLRKKIKRSSDLVSNFDDRLMGWTLFLDTSLSGANELRKQKARLWECNWYRLSIHSVTIVRNTPRKLCTDFTAKPEFERCMCLISRSERHVKWRDSRVWNKVKIGWNAVLILAC